MDELDDFMLYNACEDAREEQERGATTEYPYQKQFFRSSETQSGSATSRVGDDPCEAVGRSGLTATSSEPSVEGDKGGHRPKLGCLLLVIIIFGVLAYFLFVNVLNSCGGGHEDGSSTDPDSITEVNTKAFNPADTVIPSPEDATSDPDHPSNTNTIYPSGYYDDDEYDEDGMYKDEDEDIQEMREYDDYDDDEADDCE